MGHYRILEVIFLCVEVYEYYTIRKISMEEGSLKYFMYNHTCVSASTSPYKPWENRRQAQRLKHLITVLACMFLSDCIDSYSCMLTLLEKTRLMGLYSSSLQFEFYQNGHITRYSISGCHLQYGIFLGRAWYNTCMSLERGREKFNMWRKMSVYSG